MNRLIPVFAVLLVVLSVPALATEDPTVAVQSGPAKVEITESVSPSSALGLAIEGIRREAGTQIQELDAKLQIALSGSAETAELHRLIAKVKADAEIAVLEAIIQNAVETGDQDRLLEAEAALERLQHPERFAVPAVPSDRPAPSR